MSKSPVIAALDLPERSDIVRVAKAVRPHVGMVKVGWEAFIAHGPGLVTELVEEGIPVFLDIKVHDIPRTAAAAAREASRLGVKLLTVHAQGGVDMIQAARDAALEHTAIVAVTVLTSLDDAALVQTGYAQGVAETALGLAMVARDAGADGLVCSAHELRGLAALGGVRVVPGIRPAGFAHGDQKRVATPAEALGAGATWLVVGRPITQAEDPGAAAASILAELSPDQG